MALTHKAAFAGSLVGAVVILIATQTLFAGSSDQRRRAQAAALLSMHDRNYVLLPQDEGLNVAAELASCGLDLKEILGEGAPPVDPYKSGAWSPSNGLFDLLMYRQAYRSRWANAKREELLTSESSSLWRSAILDCLQLPGAHGVCVTILEKRLRRLRADMPDALPTGSPPTPLEPRMDKVMCTFAAGLRATKTPEGGTPTIHDRK